MWEFSCLLPIRLGALSKLTLMDLLGALTQYSGQRWGHSTVQNYLSEFGINFVIYLIAIPSSQYLQLISLMSAHNFTTNPRCPNLGACVPDALICVRVEPICRIAHKIVLKMCLDLILKLFLKECNLLEQCIWITMYVDLQLYVFVCYHVNNLLPTWVATWAISRN